MSEGSGNFVNKEHMLAVSEEVTGILASQGYLKAACQSARMRLFSLVGNP